MDRERSSNLNRTADKNRVNSDQYRLIVWFIISSSISIIIIAIVADIFFGDSSIAYQDQLKAQKQELEVQMELIQAQSLQLTRQLQALQNDQKIQEEMLRKQLDVVHEDEVLIIIPSDKIDSQE